MKKNLRSTNGASSAAVPFVPNGNAYAYGALYARLSDTRNPNEISIERQISNGHEFFKKNGIPHNCATDHYTEPPGHRSGWSEKQRPAYRQMRVDLVKRAGPGLVWCQAQERFTRAEDATTVIRHWIEDVRVDLVFDAEFVSLATFDLWLQVHTRTFIHSIESQLGSSRMTRYFKKFYDTGAEHRRNPIFGLKIEGRGAERHNVANPDTLPAVVGFLELYATGKVGTGTQGVRLMRASGYQFHDRQHHLRAVTSTHLLSIVRHLEHYQPFVTASLYQRCLRVRAARKNHAQNSARLKSPPLLLRGLLECGTCGAPLYQQRNEYTKYDSYRHPNSKNVCPYEGVYRVARPLDAQAMQKLRELESLSAPSRKRIIALWTKVPRDVQGEKRRAARAALLAARERLLDGWLTAGLTPEEFKQKRMKLDAELATYPEQAAPPAPRTDPQTATRLFDELPANLLAAAHNPEIANDLASAFFKRCVLDFVTLSVCCECAWE